MTNDGEDDKDVVGYRNPPKSTRFQKGQCANPKGRPRGRRIDAPYEAVLGQLVTVREDGVERRVTAAEAFLLHLTQQGLAGNGAAARAAMPAIEEARAVRWLHDPVVPTLVVVAVAPDRVNHALRPLRMARKLDRYRETARMALEPWIVEAALSKFDDRRLTVEEQKIVVKATRTPDRVRWPEWWSVR